MKITDYATLLYLLEKHKDTVLRVGFREEEERYSRIKSFLQTSILERKEDDLKKS
jgi:hypothetical protein